MKIIIKSDTLAYSEIFGCSKWCHCNRAALCYAKYGYKGFLGTCIASLSTAVDVRHELYPVLVRLEIEGGAFAPSAVVAQPVIVLQMGLGEQILIYQPRNLSYLYLTLF